MPWPSSKCLSISAEITFNLRSMRDRIERRLKVISAEMDKHFEEGHGMSPSLRQKLHEAETKRALLLQEITALEEQRAVERERAMHASASAGDAFHEFKEWLSKYSIAAGRNRFIPKKQGVSPA